MALFVLSLEPESRMWQIHSLPSMVSILKTCFKDVSFTGKTQWFWKSSYILSHVQSNHFTRHLKYRQIHVLCYADLLGGQHSGDAQGLRSFAFSGFVMPCRSSPTYLQQWLPWRMDILLRMPKTWKKQYISLIEPKVATVTAHTAIMLKAYRLPSDLLDLLDVNHRHWLLGAKDPRRTLHQWMKFGSLPVSF